MVPSERSCHKEHTCQILKPYLLRQKSYKETKSVTDGQTARQTDGRIDRHTDTGQSDPLVALCFAGATKIKVKKRH